MLLVLLLIYIYIYIYRTVLGRERDHDGRRRQTETFTHDDDDEDDFSFSHHAGCTKAEGGSHESKTCTFINGPSVDFLFRIMPSALAPPKILTPRRRRGCRWAGAAPLILMELFVITQLFMCLLRLKTRANCYGYVGSMTLIPRGTGAM